MQGCDLRLDAGVSVDSRKEFSRGDGRGWATVDEEASKSFRGIGISLGNDARRNCRCVAQRKFLARSLQLKLPQCSRCLHVIVISLMKQQVPNVCRSSD